MTVAPLTQDEFDAAERMLAALLAGAATPEEEARILTLHARIRRLFEAGAEQRASRDKLYALHRQAGLRDATPEI